MEQSDHPTNVGSNACLGPMMDEARIAGAEVTDYVNYAYGDDVAVFDEESLRTLVLRVKSAERAIYAPLMTAVENILDDGHMNQEHLARLRAAWESV